MLVMVVSTSDAVKEGATRRRCFGMSSRGEDHIGEVQSQESATPPSQGDTWFVGWLLLDGNSMSK